MSEDLKAFKVQLDRIEKITTIAAKQMLTVEDVVFITGLSKPSIYRYMASGSIPHYKPNGRRAFFNKTEIEKWLQQNRVLTTDEINSKATTYITTGRM